MKTLCVFLVACVMKICRGQPGDRPAARITGGMYDNCWEGYHCPNALCGIATFKSTNITGPSKTSGYVTRRSVTRDEVLGGGVSARRLLQKGPQYAVRWQTAKDGVSVRLKYGPESCIHNSTGAGGTSLNCCCKMSEVAHRQTTYTEYQRCYPIDSTSWQIVASVNITASTNCTCAVALGTAKCKEGTKKWADVPFPIFNYQGTAVQVFQGSFDPVSSVDVPSKWAPYFANQYTFSTDGTFKLYRAGYLGYDAAGFDESSKFISFTAQGR